MVATYLVALLSENTLPLVHHHLKKLFSANKSFDSPNLYIKGAIKVSHQLLLNCRKKWSLWNSLWGLRMTEVARVFHLITWYTWILGLFGRPDSVHHFWEQLKKLQSVKVIFQLSSDVPFFRIQWRLVIQNTFLYRQIVKLTINSSM